LPEQTRREYYEIEHLSQTGFTTNERFSCSYDALSRRAQLISCQMLTPIVRRNHLYKPVKLLRVTETGLGSRGENERPIS